MIDQCILAAQSSCQNTIVQWGGFLHPPQICSWGKPFVGHLRLALAVLSVFASGLSLFCIFWSDLVIWPLLAVAPGYDHLFLSVFFVLEFCLLLSNKKILQDAYWLFICHTLVRAIYNHLAMQHCSVRLPLSRICPSGCLWKSFTGDLRIVQTPTYNQ